MAEYQPAFKLTEPFRPDENPTAEVVVHYELNDPGRPYRSFYKKKFHEMKLDTVEEIVYCYVEFLKWYSNCEHFAEEQMHNAFAQLLDHAATALWDEVMDAGDPDTGNDFDDNEAGFDLTIKYFILKYNEDPEARHTMMEWINNGKWVIPGNMTVMQLYNRYNFLSKQFNMLSFDAPLPANEIKRAYLRMFPNEWRIRYRQNNHARFPNQDLRQITTYMEGEEKLAPHNNKRKRKRKADGNGNGNKNKKNRNTQYNDCSNSTDSDENDDTYDSNDDNDYTDDDSNDDNDYTDDDSNNDNDNTDSDKDNDTNNETNYNGNDGNDCGWHQYLGNSNHSYSECQLNPNCNNFCGHEEARRRKDKIAKRYGTPKQQRNGRLPQDSWQPQQQQQQNFYHQHNHGYHPQAIAPPHDNFYRQPRLAGFPPPPPATAPAPAPAPSSGSYMNYQPPPQYHPPYNPYF